MALGGDRGAGTGERGAPVDPGISRPGERVPLGTISSFTSRPTRRPFASTSTAAAHAWRSWAAPTGSRGATDRTTCPTRTGDTTASACRAKSWPHGPPTRSPSPGGGLREPTSPCSWRAMAMATRPARPMPSPRRPPRPGALRGQAFRLERLGADPLQGPVADLPGVQPGLAANLRPGDATRRLVVVHRSGAGRRADLDACRHALHRPGGGTGGTPSDIWNFDPSPRQTFVHWDAPFIAWLESNGYELDYCTDLDLHHDGDLELLARYRLLVSVGLFAPGPLVVA